MNNQKIEKYLSEIENTLISKSKKIDIKLNKEWTKQFPKEPGVYIFRENEIICYIGETKNIHNRMKNLLNTHNHNIRRNIGKLNFINIKGYQQASSKKKFPEKIEKILDNWIEAKLTVSFISIKLGRKELEERLIKKFGTKYNIRN